MYLRGVGRDVYYYTSSREDLGPCGTGVTCQTCVYSRLSFEGICCSIRHWMGRISHGASGLSMLVSEVLPSETSA